MRDQNQVLLKLTGAAPHYSDMYVPQLTEDTRLSLRDAWCIGPPIVVSGLATSASALSPYPLRTDAVYALEGDIVELFQPMVHPVAVWFFITVYILVYACLLLSTYIGLKREGRGRHVAYATTYTVVILVSTPVFYFVPVGVTGYYLDGVEPLLYEFGAGIGSSMTTVDTLQKALPSLHTGLSLTASLYAPDGYRLLSWTATALVVLSTLYLGIHWLVDLAAGGALAYACYRLTPAILRVLRTTEQRLRR